MTDCGARVLEQPELVDSCAVQLPGQPEEARTVLIGFHAVIYVDRMRRDHPGMPGLEVLRGLKDFLLAVARRHRTIRSAGGAHVGTA